MQRNQLSFCVMILTLLFPCVATAGVKIGNIQFDDRGKIIFANTSSGKIIFPDKTEQGSATAKGDPGPKGDLGDKGDKGDKGDPGQVDKNALCQIYSTEGVTLPAFCSKKVVFLTSQKFDANLGGLTGADQKCQNLASAASLSGTFKAWLSDTYTNARDRLTHNPAPYIRTDGAVVANNWFDLTDGNLKDSIICDESKVCGDPYLTENNGFAALVFTGTGKTGLVSTKINLANCGTTCFCADWTTTAQSNEGSYALSTVGLADQINDGWTYYMVTSNACYIKYRLYCIEQ